MTLFRANQERAVCLEFRGKLTVFFAAVHTIYLAARSWTLTETEPLPDPEAVLAQLTAFQALTLPTLLLTDWAAELQGAHPDDVLRLRPIFADGSILADGSEFAQ